MVRIVQFAISFAAFTCLGSVVGKPPNTRMPLLIAPVAALALAGQKLQQVEMPWLHC